QRRDPRQNPPHPRQRRERGQWAEALLITGHARADLDDRSDGRVADPHWLRAGALQPIDLAPGADVGEAGFDEDLAFARLWDVEFDHFGRAIAKDDLGAAHTLPPCYSCP